jgi:hypothetical protein
MKATLALSRTDSSDQFEAIKRCAGLLPPPDFPMIGRATTCPIKSTQQKHSADYSLNETAGNEGRQLNC